MMFLIERMKRFRILVPFGCRISNPIRWGKGWFSTLACAILSWSVLPVLLISAQAHAQTGKPDLVITMVSAPPVLVPTRTATIRAYIANVGRGNAGAFSVAFSVDGKNAGSGGASSLRAGRFTTAQISYRVPINIRSGSIVIMAMADSTGRVAESNEGNNTGKTTVISLGGTDLRMASFSSKPSGPWKLGSKRTFSLSVANLGSRASPSFETGIFLSKSLQGGLLLGKVPIGSVGGNSTSSRIGWSLTLPTYIQPGKYYLIAYCDYQNRVWEINETNNRMSFGTVIYLEGSYTSYGTGCKGSNGIPVQRGQAKTPSTDPHIGSVSNYLLTSGPRNSMALLMMGISDSAWGSIKLPFGMATFGAKGCSLLTGPMIQLAALTDAKGATTVSISIPDHAALTGLAVYSQYLGRDTQANALGLSFSQGVKTRIGSAR